MKLIIDNQIKENYVNLKEYFDVNKIGDKSDFAMYFKEGYFVFLTDCLSFFFLEDENRFIYDMTYFELPFSKYLEYNIDYAELREAPAIGSGDFDIISEVIKLYEIINTFVIDNPFGFEISMVTLGYIIKAIKVLKNNMKPYGNIWGIFDYCKKHNIKICLKSISDNKLNYLEEKEINEGLKKLQELNDLGLLQKILDKYNEAKGISYVGKHEKKGDKEKG